MTKNRRFVLFTVCLLSFGILACLAAKGDNPETGRRTGIEELSWMAGYWAGEVEGVRMEECWLHPGGGLMVGVHRDVKGDGSGFFEYLRIEEDADGIQYLASPSGGPVTSFRLTSTATRSATFENPEHDYPKRIRYWLDSEERLHARIDGGAGEDSGSSEWVWDREEL